MLTLGSALRPQVKEANPDFGAARVRAVLKDNNGWELSEKRVKKALAEIAEGKATAGSPAGAAAAVAAGAGNAAIDSGAPETAVAGSWAVERPSPRGYFSLTAVEPSAGQAVAVMFGGEYFDNSKNLFYNQLYVLGTQSRGWSRFSGGNSPSARSAHQACVCAGHYWVFGGEFSSPTGNKFKLMDDLWRMPLSGDGEMSGGKWHKVAAGGAGADAPGPRSGHRMVAVGHLLILYGGMGESKYYSDLHVWDTLKGAWISKMVKMQQLKMGKEAKTPGPRGGFAMWPDGDAGLYIWGGTRDKGRNDSEYLDDLWRLDISSWAWERVVAPGGPGARSGPAVAVVGADKRKVVFFGGVVDVDNTVSGVKGKPQQRFLADMLCFDMDVRAWSALLGVGAGGAGGAAGAAGGGGGAAAAAETGAAAASQAGAAAKASSPAARRNAQAVFLSSSSSLILVGGLRDELTQGEETLPPKL